MFVLPLLTAVLLSTPSTTAATEHAAVTARPLTVEATDVGFPRFPKPKFRIPGRAKRNAAAVAMTQVDRRLRLLVSQEEAWYAQHSRYGREVPRVARLDAVADSSLNAVQVQVLYASTKGWMAMASHPDAPGKSCVVFVGVRERLPLIPRTRADATVAENEGRPACDK